MPEENARERAMRPSRKNLIREDSCNGLTMRRVGTMRGAVWVIYGPDGKRIDSALTREVAKRRCRRLKLFAETPDAAPGNERS